MPSQSLQTISLSLNNLSCIRGERILFKDLSHTVIAGQCAHIVGPNGSGKTSLLRILCGLTLPDSGSVKWQGQAIDHEYFNQSQYIGHKDGLKSELTAFENLRFYQLAKANGNRPISEDILDECLNTMQILHCADLLAQQLSFGQRRRLAFARLLINPKPLWILDEPFTGIDKSGRALIENLCLQHVQSGGIIILTHHQSLSHSLLIKHLSEITL